MKPETKNMFKSTSTGDSFNVLDSAKSSLDSALKEGATKEEFSEERLKSPKALRSMNAAMIVDDQPRSDNRAKVQAMVDYKAPYSQAILDKLGRGSQFNINFGEGAATINDSVNNYLDIFTNPSSLAMLPIKQEYGAPVERQQWSEILSTEFTRMVRLWDEAQFTFLELVNQFVIQGVAFSSFRSGDDWRWSAGGLNEYRVPSRSKATSSSFEIIISEEPMPATKLYSYIKNEGRATKEGWNVEAVRRAIVDAAKKGNNKYDEQSPEAIEEKIKAHDFDTASPVSSVNLVHARVREYDGRISQYICTKEGFDKDGEVPDTWLFRKRNAYKTMKEAVQVFPFFTGNNGNLHTIRGLGHVIFPQVQASNLMQCKALDSASDAMSTTYVANSETDLNKLPIINAGSARLIPSTLQVAENQHSPDLQKSAMPAMNLLRDQISRMSSSSAMNEVLSNGQDRRSKFEVSAAIEYFSAINAAAMRLFFKPWREVLITSAKRAFTGAVSTSDWGEAASRMRQNCIDRGVPEDVIKNGINFEQAMVDLPLGLGNKAAKEAIYNKGAELLSYMDDAGRRRFSAARAIDLFGEENAKYFIPMDGLERPPIDHKIAQMENNMLSNGMPITVDNGEDFMVHLKVHIQWLWEYDQAVNEGEIELIEAVQKMKPVYDHTVETFSVAQVPDESVPELNNAKQAIQQLGEIIANGLKAIQKMQREQQQQQEQQAQPQQEVADKNQAALIKAQADAEIKIEMARLTNELKQQTHDQKMAFDKQKTEQEMMMNQIKAAQDRALADMDKASQIRRSPES